ncbi:DUF5819 family protein [Promicromonospora sp. NPDC052451]|uniref:DUF5819 family protein n=1 Tax=Promicromonospora sp. NPDC052451 TaxID=3364407 RepID=UPI0037C69816
MSDARDGTGDTAPAVSRRLRGLVLAVWALLIAHLAATLLWTAPGWVTGRPQEGPLSAEPSGTAGYGALETWMTPVFDQGWSLFAPEPLHVDYTLRVRGVYRGGGGAPVPGPWIDASAVELRALTGHALPAATERPARRVAAEAREAYLALPEAGRGVVLRSTAAAPDVSGHPVAWAELRAALLGTGAAAGVVDRYLAADRALAAYATQVVRASGSDRTHRRPVSVQAEVVRRPVPPYASAERPRPTTLTFGARPLLRLPGQDDAAFGAVWARLQELGHEAGR